MVDAKGLLLVGETFFVVAVEGFLAVVEALVVDAEGTVVAGLPAIIIEIFQLEMR